MLKQVNIKGYKSIRNATIHFNRLNLLIGENGAGKSNLLSFFAIAKVAPIDLNLYIQKHMGMDRLLYGGIKRSESFSGTLLFDGCGDEVHADSPSDCFSCGYTFSIGTAIDGFSPVILDLAEYMDVPKGEVIEAGRRNNLLSSESFNISVPSPVKKIETYHFSDTGEYSKIRGKCSIDDNRFLKSDGSNLAAMLYLIYKTAPVSYRMIVAMMRQVAPYFSDFDLRPDRLNPGMITVEWKERNSEVYLDSTSFSDGTIRFLALCVLFLQPDPPQTIIVDEPELGLHPSAISILASLIKKAEYKSQIIIATQSPDLISEFAINNVIVVEREDGQSVFRRLETSEFEHWLEDYTLGELWKKNIIGGRP